MSLQQWFARMRGAEPVQPTEEQEQAVQRMQEMDVRVAMLEQEMLVVQNRMGIRHDRSGKNRQSA